MKLDALAIGSHPDDVELGCGGIVALLASRGRKVGIVHLTRGERGTRGTAEERRREAEAAASALGAVELVFLDCGDGALRHGEAEEDAVIEVLRRFQPELVLGPTPSDRHPDHGRSHRLVADACFYAGLANRGPAGPPHRPAAVFSYMQHDGFEPSLIVDVTAVWEQKMASLNAYRSQIFQPGAAPEPADAPKTKVGSREFRLTVEGRARHFGQMIGAELGEPLWSRLPLAVADLFTVLPGGLR